MSEDLFTDAERKLGRVDLYNDDDFVESVAKYRGHRYEDTRFDIFSDENRKDLVDRFMEEYRFIHSNTLNLTSFTNYIYGLDEKDKVDQSAKEALRYAYKTVDEKVENFISDDSITTAQKAQALGDYVLAGISDPINLLSLGVGKAVLMSVGRPAINTLIKKVLYAGVPAFATEGAIGAGFDIGLQKAEIELGSREKASAKQTAIATGISALTGGVLGTVGARETAKLGNEVIESLEAAIESGKQGQAAKQEKLSDFITDNPLGAGDAENVYVFRAGAKDGQNNLDNIGRVERISDEGIATVKFKKVENGRVVNDFVDIAVDELNIAKNKTVLRYYKKYTDDSRVGLDPEMVQKGLDALENLSSSIGATERGMFAELKPELVDKVHELFIAIRQEDSKFADMYDPTERIAQNVANLIAAVPRERLSAVLGEQFERLGMSAEEFAQVYLAEAHRSGSSLAARSALNIADFNAEAISNLNLVNQSTRESLEEAGARELFDKLDKKITKHNETRDQFRPLAFLNDVWRGNLVSQVVTTVRNLYGIIPQLGTQTFNSLIDNKLHNVQRKALGLPPQESYNSKQVSDFVVQIFRNSDNVRILRYLGDNFEQFREVDKQIFRTLDVLDTEFSLPNKDKIISYNLALLGREGVKAINILNRALDHAVKSSAFVNRMNSEIIDAKNAGVITDEGINNFLDVIRQNKLELITPEMIENSIRHGYDVSFIGPRPGMSSGTRTSGRLEDYALGLQATGRLADNFIKLFESKPGEPEAAIQSAAKFLVPFARFVGNSFVYVTNRTLLLPANVARVPIKAARIKLSGKKLARTRQEIIQLESEIKDLAKQRQESFRIRQQSPAAKLDPLQEPAALTEAIEEKALLRHKKKELIDDSYKDYAALRGSIVSTMDGTMGLLIGGAMYKTFGTEEVGVLENEDGQRLDIKAAFPFSQYYYTAALVLRYADALKEERKTNPDAGIGDISGKFISNNQDLVNNFINQFVGGVSVRSGVLANIQRDTRRYFEDPNALQFSKVVESAAGMLGKILNGFTTFSKQFTDVARDVLPEKGYREYQDKNLQSLNIREDLLAKLREEDLVSDPVLVADVFSNILDTVTRETVRGSPLEAALFGVDKPKLSPVTGKPIVSSIPSTMKIITGGTPRPRGTEIEKQFADLGLILRDEARKAGYSSQPVYENIFPKYFSRRLRDDLSPLFVDPEFRRLSKDDKRIQLENIYLPNAIKKAREDLKKDLPLLHELHTYYKKPKNERKNSEALFRAMVGESPDLRYIAGMEGENADPKLRVRRDNVARTLKQLSELRKDKGPFSQQMRQLGLTNEP